MSLLFNNPQQGLDLVFMLSTKLCKADPKSAPEGQIAEGRINFTIDMLNDDRWDTETSIQDFLASFEERELSEHNDGSAKSFQYELVRAANRIAFCSRRGMGNAIYRRAADAFEDQLDGAVHRMFNFYDCEYIREGYALVMYEGKLSTPMDVGAIYNPTRGILKNKDHEHYGRLVKIVR